MVYQHPFRMKWMKNMRTIIPCPTKNSVTLYPPWRINNAGTGILTKSRGLSARRLSKTILIATQYQQGSCNKKASTCVLPFHKQNKSNTPKYGGIQRYWVMFKKAVIPEHKYIFHSFVTWFGNRSDKDTLKEGMGRNLSNRYAAIKYFQSSEKEV